jgi:hypothetical protein
MTNLRSKLNSEERQIMNAIITHRKEMAARDTMSARTQQLVMNIEGVGKQSNTKYWDLRDVTLG